MPTPTPRAALAAAEIDRKLTECFQLGGFALQRVPAIAEIIDKHFPPDAHAARLAEALADLLEECPTSVHQTSPPDYAWSECPQCGGEAKHAGDCKLWQAFTAAEAALADYRQSQPSAS